jgi:hypothetical protein
MRTILCTIIILLALTVQAQAGEFYQYTTVDETISFTDREKAIPKAYKANAVKRDTSEIDVKLTAGKALDAALYRASLADRLADLRARSAARRAPAVEACAGHVLVTSQRIQVGDYNRRIFVATDECGRTRSVTSFYPDVQINR